MGGSAKSPHPPSALHVFEVFLAYLIGYFDHLDVFIARDLFINTLVTILSSHRKSSYHFLFHKHN